MVSEVSDVNQFLSAHPLFIEQGEDLLLQASHSIHTAFAKAGDNLPLWTGGDSSSATALLLIRSGSLEIRESSGTLRDRLSVGDFIFPMVLVQAADASSSIKVLEDCLYYEIDNYHLQQLCKRSKHLADARAKWERPYRDQVSKPSDAVSSSEPNIQNLNVVGVNDYMCEPAICAPPSLTILDAACLMKDKKISSLLISEGDELVGIMTDRDLRTRVVAEGLSTSLPVSTVMTIKPTCIEIERPLHDAQLMMISESVHHLPVMNKTSIAGIISLSDILRARNGEPLTHISSIKNAKSVEALAREAKNIPALIVKLIERDTRAVEVGEIITAFTDGMTRRLLQLAREQLGDPPCDYAWLAFGSQARQEQMLGSDQDNAIVLEREINEEEKAYFLTFTRFVNQGLDRCGVPLCSGNIMASNPKWSMPLENWKSCFDRWITQPSPKALMHASIFFDMRYIAGNKGYIAALQKYVLSNARTNTIFQAHMSGNALMHTAPLGFFKNFVLENDGDHVNSLDLKKRGTIPIVDFARNYSLSVGIAEVNSISRLYALEKQGVVSKELASSLVDAHEFIAGIRLQAQASEYRAGKKVDNHIDPKAFSALLRHQLKDAFQVVRDAQSAMKSRFGAGVL